MKTEINVCENQQLRELTTSSKVSKFWFISRRSYAIVLVQIISTHLYLKNYPIYCTKNKRKGRNSKQSIDPELFGFVILSADPWKTSNFFLFFIHHWRFGKLNSRSEHIAKEKNNIFSVFEERFNFFLNFCIDCFILSTSCSLIILRGLTGNWPS